MALWIVYRILRTYVRLACAIWFRKLQVHGRHNIPREGGVVFAGNHANHLFDPMLLTTQSRPRIVRFAAKDSLFRSWLAPILYFTGAVPVKRRIEHKEGKLDNDAAFEALEQTLISGGAIGIFPEGVGHTEAHLLHLKTGTSRIAMRAAAAGQKPVRIVPVGLTYLTRDKFRSSAVVLFGEPITIGERWVERWQADDRGTVKALTEDLEQRMRALVLDAPDWETMHFLHAARRLILADQVRLTPTEWVELTKRFCDGYAANKDKPDIQEYRKEVEVYQNALREMSLRDHMIRKPISVSHALLMTARRLIYLFLLLPLSLFGFGVHLPIILLAVLSDHREHEWDIKATKKMVVGLFFTPVCALLIFLPPDLIGLSDMFPTTFFDDLYWSIPVFFALLPITGYACVRVMESELTIARSIISVWRLVVYGPQFRELQRMRSELVPKTQAIVRKYMDRSLPPVQLSTKPPSPLSPRALSKALTGRGGSRRGSPDRLGDEDEEPIREGVLLKKARRLGTWRRRRFILKSRALRYYDMDGTKTKQQRGTILLHKITEVAVSTRHPDIEFEFEIRTAAPAVYHLGAETKAELDKWVSAIDTARDHALFELNAGDEPAIPTPAVPAIPGTPEP